MSALVQLTLVFGIILWLLILVVSVVLLCLVAIKIWEAACFTGYLMFARKAEKDAVREQARREGQ